MTKAEKKYVVAFTHAQARHFASTMDWKRSEWEFLSKPEQLKGLHSIILYDVRTPGYKPNPNETAKMDEMRYAIVVAQNSQRIAKTNVVNL
jgi:epoxyqueuosine reductase QueG